MISSTFIIPLLMFMGSSLLWVRLRKFSALFMAVGFFLVLASTTYTLLGPKPFVFDAGRYVPNEIHDMLAAIVFWGKSVGGLIASVAFVVFAIRH